MSEFVLTPMSKSELSNFFDDDSLKVIQFFLQKSLVSQPETLPGQKDLPIQIPKEHIEQWIVQALNARPVGSGSYPVDVLGDDWAADVKMLSCGVNKNGALKNSDSGETSLSQKFSSTVFGKYNTLDELFARKDYKLIWDKWQQILIDKYKVVNDDHGITKIYYFIVLRAGNIFHLCGLKLNIDLLSNTEIDYSNTTETTIWINNFINKEFGKVKIYKSKKRVELRLRPKAWVSSGLTLDFDSEFENININIKCAIQQGNLSDHIADHLIPILQKTSD